MTVAASTTLGLALTAQQPEEVAGPSGSPDSIAELGRSSIISQSHGLARVEGALVGVGERYKAEFEAGAVTFTPALGSKAPHNLPLKLSLAEIGRDGAQLLQAAAAALPEEDDKRVTYRAGAGVQEHWDVTPAGLELSYVFPSRPAGSGDLVVRLDLETELTAAGPADESGLLFHAEGIGGVHVGAVTGIDANGATAAGGLRLVDGDLELVLPGAFVDGAAYPLVLDPLIGTNFDISNSSFDDGDPDAAYEGTSANYLVVWERRYSSSNAAVLGQRVSSNGLLLGSTIYMTSGTSTIAVDPRVAAVGGNLTWVVAYQYAPNAFSVPNIAVIGVGPDSSIGSQVLVSPSGSVQTDPAIGGTRAFNSYDCLVAWEQSGTGINARRVTAFDLNPFPTGSTFLVDSNLPLASAYNPAISRSAHDAGVWFVAWERIDGSGDGAIWGSAYDQSGNSAGQGRVQLSDPFSATDSAHPSVDGDGEYFVVAWEKEEPGGGPERDIVAMGVQVAGGIISLETRETFVENGNSDDEYFASVAWTGESAVVGFLDVNGSFTGAYLKSIDPFGCQLCGDEILIDNASSTDSYSIRLASAYHGGDEVYASDDVLAVYERYDSALGHSHSFGQLFDPYKDGADLGGSTPGGGIHSNPCLVESNANFTARLREAPALSTSYFVVSLGSQSFGCGSGMLIPAFDGTHQVFSAPTQSDGDASLAIPVPPGTAGTVVYSQWATLSPGGACPLIFGFELSNALQTTIQP